MGVTVFDGIRYREPVAKSRIISGIQNSASPASFGNICIIDNGAGAGYGGGKGSYDGAAARTLDDMLNTFNSASEMKRFVKGGILYDLADYLYSPSNQGRGATTVYLIHARQSTPAVVTLTLDAALTLKFGTKEEGLVANAVIDTLRLAKGYAVTTEAGTAAGSLIFKFWRGTYRGVDGAGRLFDGLTQDQAADSPQLIAQSIECTTVGELRAWAEKDADFQTYFVYDPASDQTAVDGTALDSAADIFTVTTGSFLTATETYNTTAFDAVLDAIQDLDNSFFLSLDNGADAAGVDNIKIISHINNEASRKKFLVTGLYDTGLSDSITAAGNLNTRYAIGVHSGLYVPDINNPAIEVAKSSVYHAALVCGRLAGVTPETPLTYKNLRITKLQDELKNKYERELAIAAGVLHTRRVARLGYVVNQSINTLQLNDNLVNPDGSSPEISVERIMAQMNYEIDRGLTPLFIGKNRSQVSAGDLVSYVNTYLKGIQAVDGVREGMIINFFDVVAERQGTVYFVTYSFEANTPINKIFTTGTIVDSSLS